MRWSIVSRLSYSTLRAAASAPCHHIPTKSPSRPQLAQLLQPLLATNIKHASQVATVAPAENEVDEHGSSPDAPRVDEAEMTGPITKFAELGDRGIIDKSVINTLVKKMGLETMTEVQSLTINEAIKGIDVYEPSNPSSCVSGMI